uniref:Mediator complex subunit 30 n=1 Tax=Acrobeloides nanus TaxID=290746 RepID=A0A914D8X7_9BILA
MQPQQGLSPYMNGVPGYAQPGQMPPSGVMSNPPTMFTPSASGNVPSAEYASGPNTLNPPRPYLPSGSSPSAGPYQTGGPPSGAGMIAPPSAGSQTSYGTYMSPSMQPIQPTTIQMSSPANVFKPEEGIQSQPPPAQPSTMTSTQYPTASTHVISNQPPLSLTAPFQTQLPKKASIEERIKNLAPSSPFPPGFLENLQNHSIGTLCNIGKEIAHEILLRTVFLIQWVQVTAEKRAQRNCDVEAVLVYCKRLMSKLVEVRLRVDLALAKSQPLDADSYITMMSVPAPPDTTPAKQRAMDTFEKNRIQLITLSNTLKKLEWHSLISDPRHL